MGCSSSVDVGNTIDAQLVAAIVASKAKRKRTRADYTFNELLLKFPRMAAGFKKCRELFKLLDTNGDKLIDMQEFTSQAHKLGLEGHVKVLKDIFHAADVDDSKQIDAMEFVLVFVIIHLLYPAKSAMLDPDIRNTLDIIEEAFGQFDASADGLLEREEVAKVMCSRNTPGRANLAISEQLFNALDWDGSNSISFKEFLLGLERMVMEEYEDEDEEDEGNTEGLAPAAPQAAQLAAGPEDEAA